MISSAKPPPPTRGAGARAAPGAGGRGALPEELANSPIAYPSAAVLANTETFEALPEEINAAMDRAWSDMKSYDENGSGWVVPVFLVSAMGLAAFNIWRRRAKRRRKEMY